MQALPTLSFGQSLKLACKNYCNFSGRSRRSEFFYFYITINITIFILYFIVIFLSINNVDPDIIVPLILFIFFFILVTFVPILSSMIRRLHDTGKSGWHVLSFIIPIFFLFIPMLNYIATFGYYGGQIYVLVLCCTDSQKMTNEYGPSPKYISNSGNLMTGNNYTPPSGPINQYSQPNSMQIPVNSINYPNPQQNAISPEDISYPQQNPVLNQEALYPQQNPIQYQKPPNSAQNYLKHEVMNNQQSNISLLYPQQNLIQNHDVLYPQQNPIQYQKPPNLPQNYLNPEVMNNQQPNISFPQNINNSEINPIGRPPEGAFYPPLDDPYSKPNPMQP